MLEVPVKFRPKMSSSGGRSFLGVVVFSMLSFDGSIPAIFVPTDASAWMLYCLVEPLRHRSDALSSGTKQRREVEDIEDSNRRDRCCNMLEFILRTENTKGKWAGVDRFEC
jgi:hypothetical protein